MASDSKDAQLEASLKMTELKAMKWVTKFGIRINRTATIWVVRRFINAEASVTFVKPEEVAGFQSKQGGPSKCRGFDAPGAFYPHKDEKGRCSCLALIEDTPELVKDRVLHEIGKIVQAADIDGEEQNHPAAAGIKLVSRGFPLVTKDDFETATKAAFLYDSLYASLKAQI